MATLIKLQISGIRSFGPSEDHLQHIKFDTPVTLIVGQNGCGKTTILEAIKYACTGDLPGGTSKGQGFVHDPKISDKVSTKGQIKLKLIDVKGDTYTITKCVQLQQRASAMSFSSLDAALSIVRSTGEKQHTSGRCVDIEKHCAQILQVSPCIINNVLFCHQENSSWPLEEGKKVKEKFDEIFDSKKYNKCGEILTKLLKTKIDEVKYLKVQIESLEAKKNEVGRKKEKLLERKMKYNSIIEEAKDKTAALNPHRLRLEEIEKLEVDLSKLQKQLTTKVTEKKGIIQQQDMLQQNISVYEGTDEELQIEIISFEQNQKEKEKTIEMLEIRKRDIEKKENQMDRDFQKTQIKLGQLREEKKQFEIKQRQQNELFKKAKESLEMENSLTWNTTGECQAAINKLKLKLKEIDENLENIIESKTKEQSIKQEKIDKVRESLATTKQKVLSTRDEIIKTEEKVLQVTNEIQELEVASSKLAEIGKKIDTLVQTLANLQNDFDENNTEALILNNKKEITQIEETLEDLERLYKVLQQNHIIEEKLNAEEQRKVSKKTECIKLKNKHANNFQHIFKDVIPQDKIGKKIQTILDHDDNEIKQINNKICSVQKEITTIETQIKHQTQEIEKSEKELNSKKSEITTICDGKNFSTFLKETYEKKEKLQKERGQFSSAKIMYEKFIEMFKEEKACCPICDTDFSDRKNVLKGVIEKLKQKIRTIPEKLMLTEKNLKKEEQLYDKLQQLKPAYEDIEVLSNVKLPLLNEQLQTYKNDFSSLNKQLLQLNNDLKVPTRMVNICRTVLADATLLDQYNHDVRVCEENINELASQKTIVGTEKSIHEVENEIENLKADLQEKRKSNERIRQRLDHHKQRCMKYNEDKSKLIELQMKYQTQFNKKPHLEKQLEELRENYSVLLLDKEEQQVELKKHEEELKKLNKEKDELVMRNNQFINKERSEKVKKHNLIDGIMKLNLEINEYVNKNIETSLEQIVEQVTQLEEKKLKFSQEKDEILNKITEQKEEIAKQNIDLRNLKDNIALREKQKQEALLVIEITDLEKKIGNYNYQSVYEEKIKLRRKIETVEKEINSLKGQEMELKNTISDMEQDLNTSDNKNAEKNFRDKLYELKLKDKVADDLRIYIKALQNSILQFHKERMVQINERIRELWRSIYKGNDIDYIQINAEESKANHTIRQTYDYKVVQIKNGTEIEMRGRCSAGQRVLACLIIRMALAESFSPHCGILALDEPTTNLDRENLTSLAYALSNVITSHDNDSNFQLLVITHDQEFLNVLRHNVQNISGYWRVSRNPQGYSLITKERL